MLERFESLDRDLEQDLWRSDEFLHKIRTRPDYAQNVYAALCNMRWQPSDVVPILKDEYWSCSWRGAGGLVANFRKLGEDYMDYYCSGMGGFSALDDETEEEAQAHFKSKGFVPEGVVTDEIREDFAALGWHPSAWPEDKD
jgi:hypothetical protein